MDVVYPRCCGIDVHKKMVVACLITPEKKDGDTKTFSTMTDELIEMKEWLLANGCTHVAMESTASYWKPVYNLLELSNIEVMVVNAQHIKTVPGRKTDVKDAEWIASLLKHGLLRGSFIPSREMRELREIIRYRHSLIEERSRELNRIQKVLEGANIKLSSVVSDIQGKTAMVILKALAAGEEDPEVLSEFRHGRMKCTKDDLMRALKGIVGNHQRLMITTQLRHIEYLNEEIENLDQDIDSRMRPFDKILELLDTIPGVGKQIAQQIVSEIGVDMGQFPSAAHLCSWAGLVPGNNESAGKRKSGKTRKGNKKLRSALVEAANAAARKKDNYLASQYHRILARRGKKRAAVAVAHSILTIAYHIILKEQPYIELGPNYYEARKRERIAKQSVKKLEALGYKVIVEDTAAIVEDTVA